MNRQTIVTVLMNRPDASTDPIQCAARRSFLGVLFFCCLFCGCRSWPWRHGPVPESVMTCRELSNQALHEMEQGRWDAAEPLLRQAVNACPTDADARRYYAKALARRGATEQALVHFEHARVLAPHDESLCVRAGEMFLATGQIEKAALRAKWALDIDRNFADAWILRGNVKLARGDREEALADFQRALAYRPDDIQLTQQIAQLYVSLQHPDRALMYFQNLAQQFPLTEQPQDLLLLQAETCETLGRLQNAVGCYRLASKLEPSSAELFYRLARLEFSTGNTHNARLAAEQALRLQPAHAATRRLLENIASSLPSAANQPVRHAGGLAPGPY
ncbi:MAG: tetratricopeptide repeat protein [Pirellulales bacterium]